MRAPLALIVAFVAVAFVPLFAGAEHVYSHRFVFEGRVLGADGYPAPGQQVEFYAIGGNFTEACQMEPDRSITDEFGDFGFCFHVHELQSTTRVGVRVGDESAEKPMDTGFRRSYAVLRLPDVDGTEPEGWNETHRLKGKVWKNGPQNLEGVFVYGAAIQRAQVNISFELPDGTVTREWLTTDGYGDYDGTFRLADGIDATEIRVTLESMGQTHARRLDPVSHVLTVGFILRADRAPSVGAQGFSDDISEGPYPGEGIPPIAIGTIGLYAALTLAIVIRKRRQDGA